MDVSDSPLGTDLKHTEGVVYCIRLDLGARGAFGYLVQGACHGLCWQQERPYRPDVEMKRNSLFDLELLSSPRKLKYAIPSSTLVIFH